VNKISKFVVFDREHWAKSASNGVQAWVRLPVVAVVPSSPQINAIVCQDRLRLDSTSRTGRRQ
jgi:hypothetical protein